MTVGKCSFRPRSFAEAEFGCPLDHCSCGTHDPEHECEPSPYETGCPTHGHEHVEEHDGMVGETLLVCRAPDGCGWMWEDSEMAMRIIE